MSSSKSDIKQLKQSDKLPLNYRFLESIVSDAPNTYMKYTDSVFHKTNKYALHLPPKPISKMFDPKKLNNERK